MTYLDVISLANAKLYLRIDDTLTEDNDQITQMINVALKHVEDYTNILVYDREKTYLMVDGEVRVYDYPINSVTTPSDYDADDHLTEQTLYNIYCYGSETTNLVLNVGYDTPSDVPEGLIQVAYEIIDILYYGKETGKKMADLSELSKNILHQHKRFIL